jgi:hypothetical protein
MWNEMARLLPNQKAPTALLDFQKSVRVSWLLFQGAQKRLWRRVCHPQLAQTSFNLLLVLTGFLFFENNNELSDHQNQCTTKIV